MSKVFIEETSLSAIGSAIREKTSTFDLVRVEDMPEMIRSISGGDSGDYENGEELRW